MALAPNPICPRCGLMTPGYARRHHHELGSWLHGICKCCCDPDCTLSYVAGENIIITFTGLILCGAPLCWDSIGRNRQYISGIADGTYTVPFTSKIADEAKYDLFNAVFVERNKYANFSDCTGTPTLETGHLDIRVTIKMSTRILTTLGLVSSFSSGFGAGVGSYDFCNPIVNLTAPCNAVSPTAFTGGSATVGCE